MTWNTCLSLWLQFREESEVTECKVRRVGNLSNKQCVVLNQESLDYEVCLKVSNFTFLPALSACANQPLKWNALHIPTPRLIYWICTQWSSMTIHRIFLVSTDLPEQVLPYPPLKCSYVWNSCTTSWSEAHHQSPTESPGQFELEYHQAFCKRVL